MLLLFLEVVVFLVGGPTAVGAMVGYFGVFDSWMWYRYNIIGAHNTHNNLARRQQPRYKIVVFFVVMDLSRQNSLCLNDILFLRLKRIFLHKISLRPLNPPDWGGLMIKPPDSVGLGNTLGSTR